MHLCAFVSMAFLPALIFANVRPFIGALVFVFMIGVSIEILQGLMPTRSEQITDIAANAGGIVIGALIGKIFANICRSYLYKNESG